MKHIWSRFSGAFTVVGLVTLALYFVVRGIRFHAQPKAELVLEVEAIGIPGDPGKTLQLSDLALPDDFSGKAPPNAGTEAGAENAEGAPDGALSGKGGAPGSLRNIAVYQRIYQRVDGSLYYPDAFKRLGITGTVVATLKFTADGLYVPESSKVEATNDYLRVLVRRALKSGLREPIPEFAKFFRGPIALAASFRFEFTEANTPELIASRKGVSGSGLQFYRNHHHSKLQWELGPLSGMFGLPAAGLNVAWLLEKASDAVSGKRKVDPMEEYREDPDWSLRN